jgi:hypothetical protein
MPGLACIPSFVNLLLVVQGVVGFDDHVFAAMPALSDIFRCRHAAPACH